jgi:hypothetical protein
MGVSDKDYQWYQEQVVDYLADGLSADDRQQFRGLTESSPMCREFLIHAERTWNLLRQAKSGSALEQLSGEGETSTMMYGGRGKIEGKSGRLTDGRSDRRVEKDDHVDPPRNITKETSQEESG